MSTRQEKFLRRPDHSTDVEHAFLDLTDTPTTYSGYGSALAIIKVAEDGLVFDNTLSGIKASNPVDNDDIATKNYVDSIAGGKDEFIELDDTPTTYSGHGNKMLAVKNTEDGLEYVDGNTYLNKSYLSFGIHGNTPVVADSYLENTGGGTLGYIMPSNGLIKEIGIITDTNNSNGYNLWQNNDVIYTFNFDDTSSGTIIGLNIPYSQNDVLRVNVTVSGTDIDSPYVPDADTLFLAHFDGDTISSRHITNSSTIAKGMSGRANNGVTFGTTGKFDYAVDFDGSNDYIEFMHHDNYDRDEATVEFWFKPGDTSGMQYIFSKDSSGYDTGGHFDIGIYGDEVRVRSQSTTTTKEWTSSGQNLTTSNWYHIAVYVGPSGLQVFLDGTSIYTDGSWTYALTGNRQPFVLGAGTTGAGNSVVTPLNDYYHGQVCELRISGNRRYTGNFTPSSTKFTKDSNTLGLWHLDETSGPMVYDSSDTTHNAMAQDTGSDADIVTSPVKHGTHAIKMNSSRNDWLRFNHTTDYEQDEITVETWVYPYDDSYDGVIFQKGVGTTEGALKIERLISGDKIEVKYLGASTSRTITTATDSFPINEWHHISVTIDASYFRVYVDGVLSGQESLTSDYQNVWNNNKNDVYIGMKCNSSRYAQVTLDEFRISKTIRTYASSSVQSISMIVGV